MDEHEATFDVESRADAYAVERALERLYDTIREESRTVRAGADDASEMLAEFEALRDAARDRTPGTLTVVYERRDEPFED